MTKLKSLWEELQELLPAARRNVSLSRFTSIGTGGPAEFFAIPRARAELERAVDWAFARKVPLRVLGGGSNLLVSDEGVAGLVLKLGGEFRKFSLERNQITAGAAAMLSELLKAATSHGLSGLEFSIGIPATLGGALVMNAGIPEGEIGERVQWVEGLTPERRFRRLEKNDLTFAYRRSNLDGWIVLAAGLELFPDDRRLIRERIQKFQERRKRTQPLGTSNLGSVFKNPPGDSAGRLVEVAGLKGARRGGAEISRLHANWILNRGGATSQEVRELAREAQRKVREKFGITLELELREW